MATDEEVLAFLGKSPQTQQPKPAETDSKFSRYARSVAAEVISTPGIIGGITGSVEMGARWLMGEPIESAALSEQGRLRMQAMEDPTLPDEIKQAVAQNFGPGDLNSGLESMASWYNWSGDVMDLPERDMQNFEGPPLDEEIVGIIGSAFVGLPRAVVGKIAQSIAQKAGTNAAARFAVNIANTRAGNVAGKVAEVSTPFTFPLTPGRIAANAGVQVGLNDVMRTLEGRDSLLNMGSEIATGDPLKDAQVEDAIRYTKASRETFTDLATDHPIDEGGATPWDKYVMVGVGTGGLLYALSGLTGRPARAGVGAGVSFRGKSEINKNKSDVIGGQQLEQVFGASPGINTRTRVQDASAPAVEVARKAGGETFRETVDALVAGMTRAGGEQAVDTAIRFGKLPGSQLRIEPLTRIDEAYRAFDNSTPLGTTVVDGVNTQRQLANAYAVALDAKRYRANALQATQKEVQKLQGQIAKRQATGKKHVALSNRLQEAQDIVNSPDKVRMSMHEWTDADLDRIIMIGRSDPQIVEFHNRIQKAYDVMRKYLTQRGIIEGKTAKNWNINWGRDRVSMQENPLGELSTRTGIWGSARRTSKAISDTIYGDDVGKKNAISISHSRPTDIQTIKARMEPEADNKVNNPVDVVTALHRYASRAVRQAEANDVRRTIIRKMQTSRNTQNAIRVRGPYSIDQVRSGFANQKDHHLPFTENGKVYFAEFGDDLIRQALEFAPNAVGGVLNMSRRVFQAMTTGKWAPWFAPKGMLYDVFTAAVTRKPGRPLGFLDAALSNMTSGKLGIQGDPTAMIDALFGASKGIYYDAFVRNFGEWFSNHLSQRSTLFARLMEGGAQAAFGKSLQAVGESMINRYMRSSIGVLHTKANVGKVGAFIENPVDKFADVQNLKFNLADRMWTNALESIHNGAKIAMFSRGYHLLQKRYGKRPIPRKEILKLGNDIRNISGDMSKMGSSKTVTGIISTLPYANVTIQSMSHVAGMMARNPARSTIGMFNSVGLPTLAGLYLLQQSGPNAVDWYYNKVPAWQRASTFLHPASPATWQMLTDGEYDDENFDPSDFILVPMAPELVPLKEMYTAGLEAMGFRHGEIARDGWAKDWAAAAGSLANIIAPPLVSAGVEMTGNRLDLQQLFAEGRNPLREKPGLRTAAFEDKTHVGGDLNKDMVEALIALFGVASDITINMALSVRDAEAHGMDFDEGLDIALGYGEHEFKRRIPIANTAIWGLDAQYASTPLTETYYQTMRDLSPVFRQFDVEMYGMVGDSELRTRRIPGLSELPPAIKHDVDGIPAGVIKQAVAMSKQFLDRNPLFEELTSRMSALNRTKEGVRSNLRADPKTRFDTLNELELERQELARQINDFVIEPWFAEIERITGEPMDASDLVSIVERSVYGD